MLPLFVLKKLKYVLENFKFKLTILLGKYLEFAMFHPWPDIIAWMNENPKSQKSFPSRPLIK